MSDYGDILFVEDSKACFFHHKRHIPYFYIMPTDDQTFMFYYFCFFFSTRHILAEGKVFDITLCVP